ncbi:hypothetical protein PCH_Pc12g06070 [Penicillium rubens Wisconsin 54-1255]|uniref:Uncharacterized protein n=1 Tax=Penicillium rubens (strain ATCC 28089 / DSM 1075 / NRRL 1951 / Wisconsin 54-1255) TaxID=500485 RepID=B6GZX9_PENRW|nr:hypothetical protein PCH_Pc12g06070 [Penicillium rubens Wisconsin 54-1255]
MDVGAILEVYCEVEAGVADGACRGAVVGPYPGLRLYQMKVTNLHLERPCRITPTGKSRGTTCPPKNSRAIPILASIVVDHPPAASVSIGTVMDESILKAVRYGYSSSTRVYAVYSCRVPDIFPAELGLSTAASASVNCMAKMDFRTISNCVELSRTKDQLEGYIEYVKASLNPASTCKWPLVLKLDLLKRVGHTDSTRG